MSMFTRRNYVWLASVMRDIHTKAVENDSDLGAECEDCACNARTFIETLADALKDESDGFDRQRFIDAIYNIDTNVDVQ